MFKDCFWGLQGFEELRKYIKSGNEFCKDVSAILQERADLEHQYAKVLSKLSQKLNKAASGCIGTLASAWSMAATEMDELATLHKQLGVTLTEDITKPMKSLSEAQTKTRKPIEITVEKSLKAFNERRTEETKLKKSAVSAAKDREKCCDHVLQGRSGKGKISEKEITKLEKKARQSEDALLKVDRDYHDASLKAESARQEWETTVYRSSAQLQTLEEERISQMQEFLNKYNNSLSAIGPKLVRSTDKLGEAVISIDVSSDLRTVIDQKGTGSNQPEQLLMEYYAEDTNNNMDKDRRGQCLTNYLLYLQQDIDREIKGRDGVQKLIEVYHNRPNFADADTQEDVRQRLAHVNSMLNFLQANHFKISCAVASVYGNPAPTHKFSEFIERSRDKAGLPQSILRLPLSEVYDGTGLEIGAAYRAPGDGGLQMESPYDDDEFDHFDASPTSPTYLCECRVVYDYSAAQYDELTLQTGDIVKVIDKQEDGWWQGELNNKVGIFPATYVEEVTH